MLTGADEETRKVSKAEAKDKQWPQFTLDRYHEVIVASVSGSLTEHRLTILLKACQQILAIFAESSEARAKHRYDTAVHL